MCCIFTALVFVGPRFGILLWWLFDPLRFEVTFGSNWVLILLTFIFLPWTLLMYVVVAPFADLTPGRDIQGFDWIWLGLAFIVDLLSYSGGFWGNRRTIYTYVPSASMGSGSAYPYAPPSFQPRPTESPDQPPKI